MLLDENNSRPCPAIRYPKQSLPYHQWERVTSILYLDSQEEQLVALLDGPVSQLQIPF